MNVGGLDFQLDLKDVPSQRSNNNRHLCSWSTKMKRNPLLHQVRCCQCNTDNMSRAKGGRRVSKEPKRRITIQQTAQGCEEKFILFVFYLYLHWYLHLYLYLYVYLYLYL